MKPTVVELERACEDFEALKFYPLGSVGAKRTIMEMLDRMVATSEQLTWLVQTMIDRVGEWKGPRELRAVFCTRYKPLDGVEEWSELPGFTAIDSEERGAIEGDKIKRLEAAAPRIGGGLKGVPNELP